MAKGIYKVKYSWQFTKENFSEGIPSWIKAIPNITLWSQYAGRVIGGEVVYPDYKIDVREGNYIELGKDGRISICQECNKVDFIERGYIIEMQFNGKKTLHRNGDVRQYTLSTKYYIEKETSYGRWLTEEEKIDIIVEELYKIKTKAKDNLLE